VIKVAYQLGMGVAFREVGVKTGGVDWEDVGDYATPVLGAASPLLSGLASGITDPGEHPVRTGIATGMGAVGGHLGGALAGGALGYGLGSLLDATTDSGLDPESVALLGAGLGSIGGGGIASHYARKHTKGGQLGPR